MIKDTNIQAFCVDFNWDNIGKFASPGLYNAADPADHIRFYQDLGVNTIQSFAVSHNGYAWYPSKIVPTQPGLRMNFLGDLTRLGHEAGMRVFGYFSPGANAEWGERNKDEALSRTHNTYHVPFTDGYLDYLCAAIEESLRMQPVDGLMMDWLWSVSPSWSPGETALYQQLFGESLPPPEQRSQELVDEYRIRATYRAWKRIREAAKSVRPETILWLSCVDIDDPVMTETPLAREIDWLMNESPDFSLLEKVMARKGPDTTAIQCLCGWGDAHQASGFLDKADAGEIGLYGFAKADVVTTLPDIAITGNRLNIEAIRDFYRRR